LRFLLDPTITPDNALMGRREFASTDWDGERRDRAFGEERADRRHYAGDSVRRLRDAGFEELGAAIKRFVEAPPHVDAGWYRSVGLEAWREAREALIRGDADALLPPI
jgi:hypothetical protein